MKKYIPILLILLILPCFGFTFIAGQPPASTATCSTSVFSHAGTTDSSLFIGNIAGRYYNGAYINWSSSSSICKVSLQLGGVVGDISGKTFQCIIANRSGDNIDTILGTSTGVTGSNAWDDTTVEFPFATAVPVTTDTDTYVVAVTMGEVDGSNYAKILTVNGGSSALYGASFDVTGVLGTAIAYDPLMEAFSE